MDKNTRRHWGPVLILTVLEDYWVCSETDNEPMMILGHSILNLNTHFLWRCNVGHRLDELDLTFIYQIHPTTAEL